MPPRAQLTRRTPFFILRSSGIEIMPRVSFVSGICTVIKSAAAKISSSVPTVTPSAFARSSLMYGSYAMMFISKASARFATPLPMRPMPMTPSVLPRSSTPTNDLRSHAPACIVASAAGILRASESIIAIVCSVAAIVLPPGELMTMIPRSVAAFTSMLSTPTPARPMILSLSARASTSADTFDAERTMRAS